MDQVSRPLQVVLVGAVLFGAVWFVALRPKSDGGGGGSSAPATQHAAPTSTSPAKGPGSSLPGGLGKAVTKARGAAGQSDAANQRLQQATGGQAAARPAPAPARPVAPATAAAKPAPATGTRPSGLGFTSNNAAASSLALATSMLAAGVAQAAGLNLGALASARATAAVPTAAGRSAARRTVGAKLRAPVPSRATSSPTAVRAAIARGKVVVLLFWNPLGADDQLVRDELTHVSSHGGRALIVTAPVREVSRFSSVTRGLEVLQSPTVLVLDRTRHARMLAGYTDRAEIGQSLSAAIAAR